MTLKPLISQFIASWKSISMVIGVCGTCFAGVTWYANKQIEKYKQQQEQVLTKEQLQTFSVKIDNLIKSDSVLTNEVKSLNGTVNTNTAETKATSRAVHNHLENEKKYQELIMYQQDLLKQYQQLPPVDSVYVPHVVIKREKPNLQPGKK